MLVQGELGSKDDNVKDLRRWLDQAQGQLQNTQTALHESEADCKTLSLDLKAALADLQAFKVSTMPHSAFSPRTIDSSVFYIRHIGCN